MVPAKPDLDTALPSVGARVIAFVAILISGACGALIGYALVDIQGDGASSTTKALGALAGGVLSAFGVAVVAVLALRAMGEWKTIESREGQTENEMRRKPSA
ncbi:MAG: hypothetical protein ACR2LQ_00290 [Acidimicrobiales bacterium]